MPTLHLTSVTINGLLSNFLDGFQIIKYNFDSDEAVAPKFGPGSPTPRTHDFIINYTPTPYLTPSNIAAFFVLTRVELATAPNDLCFDTDFISATDSTVTIRLSVCDRAEYNALGGYVIVYAKDHRKIYELSFLI